MKLSKKITVTALSALFVCSFALSACGGGGGNNTPTHTHTYATTWTKNNTKHWKDAICEHKAEQTEVAAHTFNDEFICTVCGYKHEHAYDTAWSTNATYHWHQDSCGHNLKSDYAQHTLDNSNKCTTCNYDGSKNTYYYLQFVTSGANNIPNQKIAQGGVGVKPEDPVRNGYTFGGWYTSKRYSTKYDFNEPIDDHTTIYAKWNEIYQVRFYNLDGTGNYEQATVSANELLEMPKTTPKRDGYTFTGWYWNKYLTSPFNFDAPVPDSQTDNMNELEGYTFTQNGTANVLCLYAGWTSGNNWYTIPFSTDAKYKDNNDGMAVYTSNANYSEGRDLDGATGDLGYYRLKPTSGSSYQINGKNTYFAFNANGVSGRYEIKSTAANNSAYKFAVEEHQSSAAVWNDLVHGQDNKDYANVNFTYVVDVPDAYAYTPFALLVIADKEVTEPINLTLTATRIGDSLNKEPIPQMVTAQNATAMPENIEKPTGTLSMIAYDDKKVSIVKGEDGYYHYNSADGEIVYMMITKQIEELNNGAFLTDKIDPDTEASLNFPLTGWLYDANGKVLNEKGEGTLNNYRPMISAYAKLVNEDGVYALNDELLSFLYSYFGNNPTLLDYVVEGHVWYVACCYYAKAPTQQAPAENA